MEWAYSDRKAFQSFVCDPMPRFRLRGLVITDQTAKG